MANAFTINLNTIIKALFILEFRTDLLRSTNYIRPNPNKLR